MRQNVGINISLGFALQVFHDDIVQHFVVVVIKTDAGGKVAHFFKHKAVGRNGFGIVHQAFYQAEQIEQVRVVHGFIEFVLNFFRNQMNNAQVFYIMGNGVVNQFQKYVFNGRNGLKTFTHKKRNIFGQDNDQFILKQKHADGSDLELQLVFAGVIFGPFINHDDMFGFKFQAGQFVGVHGGGQRVFVNFKVRHQRTLLFHRRVGKDIHLCFFIVRLREFALHDIVFGQHDTPPDIVLFI